MENLNRQVLLKRRPTGLPRTEDFEIADAPLPDPLEGEVLVRGIYLSLDPAPAGPQFRQAVGQARRRSGQKCLLKPKDVWTIRSDSSWSAASAIFQHLEKTAIAIPKIIALASSPALGRTHQKPLKNEPQNRGAATRDPAYSVQ